VEPVYRRSLPAASRPVWEVSSPALFCEGTQDAAGGVEARRMDGARFPYGGGRRRQRACIHGRWSLGRGPDRWAFSDGSNSSAWMSVYCGSLQSLLAMELPLTLGERRLEAAAVSGCGGRWRTLERSVHRGSRAFVVISYFLRGLCENRVGQLSSVYFQNVPVALRVFVGFPKLNTGMFALKKKLFDSVYVVVTSTYIYLLRELNY